MDRARGIPRVVALTLLVGLCILLVQSGLSPRALAATPVGEWVQTGTPSAFGGSSALVAFPDGTAGLFSPGHPIEIYHAATGAWTTRGALPEISLKGATLLNSGRVLLIAADRALVYDPATGAVTPTGALNVARGGYQATLLASGKVLLSGGQDASNQFVGAAEIYDPVSGTWSITGSLNQLRASHAAVLLPNGKVLVAGGTGLSGSLASVEIYDPVTGTWTPGSAMGDPRSPAVGVTLRDGRILVAGSGSSAVYDPATKLWGADVAVNTSASALVVLHDGLPFLATTDTVPCNLGFPFTVWFCPFVRAALFDTQAGAWILAASPPGVASGFSMTTLTDDRVLLVSGRSAFLFSVGSIPRLEASPASVDFGSANPGTTIQFPVNLHNTGVATVTGSATTAAPFSIVAGSPFTLAPGASTTLTVGFTPPSVGSFSGVVQLTSNANAISIPVEGTGPTGPWVSGRVTNGNGAGIEAVTVNITGAATANTVTDANGNYKFFVEPNNGYNVIPTGLGLAFTPSMHNVIVGTQDVGGLDFTATLPPEHIGVFRNGLWFLDLNGNGRWDGCAVDSCLGFGLPADKPAAADWSGTGKAKIGVFRNGIWSLDLNGNGQWDGCDVDRCPAFGLSGDEPMAGDWTGLGQANIGVFRDGAWYLDLNGNGQWDGCVIDACFGFGLPGDLPIAGDWTGIGRANIGVFRDGGWFLDLNGNGQWDGCAVDACLGFGLPGDLPVVGDWTATGRAKIGVFRNGGWFLDLNGNGIWDGCAVDGCFGFGAPQDRSVVGHR